MILPMYGFVFALIVVGGLASLVAAADREYAPAAAYLGPVALFAGLGGLCLSVALPLLAGKLFQSEALAGAGFVGGYVAGLLGGAALGLRRAARASGRPPAGVRG